MKPGLYTATYCGVEKNVPVAVINGWIIRLDTGVTHFEDNFTNFQPKKAVNADAVVIEGVTEAQLLRLFNLAVLHVPLDQYKDDWRLLGSLAKQLNDKLIAEGVDPWLIPPVKEPEPSKGVWLGYLEAEE